MALCLFGYTFLGLSIWPALIFILTCHFPVLMLRDQFNRRVLGKFSAKKSGSMLRNFATSGIHNHPTRFKIKKLTVNTTSLKCMFKLNLLIAATILSRGLVVRWDQLLVMLQTNSLQPAADAIALVLALIIILIVGVVASFVGYMYGHSFEAGIRAMLAVQWRQIVAYFLLPIRRRGQFKVTISISLIDKERHRSTRIFPQLPMKFNSASGLPYLHFPLTCILLN